MLDEQGTQIFATTDDIAERVRKLSSTTIRSIGHIARLQRVLDNDADYVTASDMLAELRDDNIQLTANLREAHSLCEEHRDVASASLIEICDEAETKKQVPFRGFSSRLKNISDLVSRNRNKPLRRSKVRLPRIADEAFSIRSRGQGAGASARDLAANRAAARHGAGLRSKTASSKPPGSWACTCPERAIFRIYRHPHHAT